MASGRPNPVQIWKYVFPLHSNMCAIATALFSTITMLHPTPDRTFSTRGALGLHQRGTWEPCYSLKHKPGWY